MLLRRKKGRKGDFKARGRTGRLGAVTLNFSATFGQSRLLWLAGRVLMLPGGCVLGFGVGGGYSAAGEKFLMEVPVFSFLFGGLQCTKLPESHCP